MLSQVGAIPMMIWVTEGLTRSSAQEKTGRIKSNRQNLTRESFGRSISSEKVLYWSSVRKR